MPSPNTVDFGENLSDQQIFDDATKSEPTPQPEPTPEPPAPEPEAPAPEPVETTGGRLKDPLTGKFVAKEAKEPQEAAPETEPEAPPPGHVEEPQAEPQMPASVPSWRLAEEAQRRREAEAQNYATQQQLRQMQMQVAQWQEQMQAQREPIDPVSNPVEYQQMLQAYTQRELANIRLESNLQIAQFKHPQVFDKAYEAFYEISAGGDKATYDSVMQSPNPGEALVRWYTNRETLNRVGPDPEAFIQAEIERRMADPAFQAEVIKRFQAQNGSTPSNQQVKLPPSLSRVASAASSAEGELNASDAALWEYATAKR